jgi:mRNA interferase RelE/StbE
MAHKILIAPAARRDLKRIRGPARRRVADAIDQLATNPRPAGFVKLSGADDLYRLSAGDYRIIYTIQDDRLIVLIVRVGRRKDIYRR